MSTAAAALMQAIIDNPDDDTPPLIHADWLEDNGDPLRGDLIRVQCRLHKLAPDAPGYSDLTEREEELLYGLHHRLLAEPPPLEQVYWFNVFERGFISRATFGLRDARDDAGYVAAVRGAWLGLPAGYRLGIVVAPLACLVETLRGRVGVSGAGRSC